MSNFPSYNNLGTPDIIVGHLQVYGWSYDNLTLADIEAIKVAPKRIDAKIFYEKGDQLMESCSSFWDYASALLFGRTTWSIFCGV